MNEKEQNAFRVAVEFYAKWRETVIERDEQWQEFAADVGLFSRDADVDNCPLAWHLLTAVLETFNDLYRNGTKPMPSGYFGRDGIG